MISLDAGGWLVALCEVETAGIWWLAAFLAARHMRGRLIAVLFRSAERQVEGASAKRM